jgi:uncharacterized small protein (DUF1192 family)
MFEELEERQKKPQTPRDLEPCSIDELCEYIENLEAEIMRAKAEIEKKKAHKAIADSAFK